MESLVCASPKSSCPYPLGRIGVHSAEDTMILQYQQISGKSIYASSTSCLDTLGKVRVPGEAGTLSCDNNRYR